MRLTLRTMLAYLDDILEPADREEISRKISESEFATQLVQRIKDSTHRPRLGAPKLSGKGMGLDPNTVAEYLDNTLGGERVPDLEKICLESDTNLAEVAAAHQILTLVLGQPVDVDPAMKRRMYSINRAAEPPVPIEAVGAPTGDHFLPGDRGIIPPRMKPQVPAYLRQAASHSKWRTMVAALVLIVLLAGAVTMALGPMDRTNPVAKWLGLGQPDNQVAQNAPEKSTPSQPAPAPAPQPEEKSTPPVAEVPSTPADTGEKSPAVAESNNTPAEPSLTEPNSAAATTPEPAVITAAPAITNPIPQPAATPQPDTGATVASSLPPDSGVAPPLPTDPGRASQLPPQPQPGNLPPVTGPASDALVGRFLPLKGAILLKLDPSAGQWNRLAAGGPLSGGDKLLVLPTFRPTLALTNGITLQVPSETQLELQAPDANGVPRVKLNYGRLILMTTGQSGAKLRLDLGAARGVITFSDAEATLGVEVRRYHPPGVDPEVQDARVAADLFAVNGHMQWAPDGAAAVSLTAPQRVVLAPHPSDPANADLKQIPKWIGSEQMISLNSMAAEDLLRIISDESKPLLLELREMADHRRIELRSLSAQCLAMLDQFEPLITALNDPDEHSVWPVHIASVRSALARGPATATAVREAFQKQRGEDDGKQLYRMLWGYTRDQLLNGEATRLVGYLNHDSLDFRVLAFANLQDISKPTFGYRPDAPAVSRDGPVLRWQDLLKKGQLVPKETTPPPNSTSTGATAPLQP